MNMTGTSGYVDSDQCQPEKESEAAEEFILASAKELRDLNASTEEDFLSIGTYLQELSSQATAVSKAAGTIVGLVTGEGVQKDTGRLRDVEGLINAYFRESQVKFEHRSGSLQRMLNLIETAYGSLSIFKTIVKHLHILGVSTRIEDARLNNEGNFDMLSGHVEKLSVVIASKAEGILEAMVSLHEAMKQTLPRVLAAKNVIGDRTQDMLHSLAAGLSTLFEKRELSARTAVRLAAKSEEVSSNMSEVISSLQFHDITRQQIEHVIDMFGELSAEGSQGSANDIVNVLGDTGDLQIDQLDHARKEMFSAVMRIVDGLQGIARHLSAMLEETEEFIGVAGKENSSFLSDLTYSASFVIGSLNQNAETGTELAGAVSHVSGLIESVFAFVNDIDEIASEIELISFNAQIRAARMAGNGGALGVLSEAIRNLSDSTRNQTLEMTRTLEDVKDAALELGAADEREGSEEEIGAMTAEMKSLLDSLGESQDRLSSLLGQLKRATGELTDAVGTVVQGVDAHRRTDEVIGGIIKGLQQIIGSRKIAADAEAGKNSDHLAKLTARYTMYQERSLHQAHLDRMNGTASAVEQKDFADNVELF